MELRSKRGREALFDALGPQRLVLAESPNRPMPRTLNQRHVSAIFGFDPKTDAITL